MQITLFMAMSLNGIVSRDDRQEDFLSPENWTSFVELAREAGGVVWGRKTHEVIRGWGRRFFDDLDGLGRVVVSSRSGLTLEAGFTRAESPRAAVEALRAQGRTQAVLSGGAELNRSFAEAGLIDRVTVNLEAVVAGSGVPLFAPMRRDLKLDLEDVRPVSGSIIQLWYSVRRP